MKVKFTTLTFAAVAAFTAPAVNAATVTYYSSDKNLTASYQEFAVQKFDTTLGTLTGVNVFTEQGTISGTVKITNNGGVVLTIDNYHASLATRQKSSNLLGYSGTSEDIDPVTTSPTMVGATINPSENTTFTLGPAQTFTAINQTPTSGFFSAYEGPSGNVLFEARASQTVATSGTSYSVENITTTPFRYGITYTYDVIPEPSTALLGAIGALGLLRRRRR